MTWRLIARHDGRTTVEQWSVKLLLGFLVFVVMLSGYVYPVFGAQPITTGRFPGFVSGSLTTLVPFVGMLLSYGAVVGARESGAIRLSLSLPLSRGDLVLGKLLSRAGLLTGTLLASLLGAGALVVYPFGELEPWRFLGFLILTVLFGLVWTALGVAVSVAVSTKRRALVLGFGAVFLFVVVWDAVVGAVRLSLNAAGLVDGELPGVVLFLVGLEPGRVFGRVTTGFVTPGTSPPGPWYLNEWVALALLVLWVAGPLGLAFRRFNGSDIA
jgi:ABC-2 type transport system permease protein